MLVIPDLWRITLTSAKGVQEITLEKFVEVTVPRNSYSAKSVEALRNARAKLEAGELVDGEEINLKGLTFQRIM